MIRMQRFFYLANYIWHLQWLVISVCLLTIDVIDSIESDSDIDTSSYPDIREPFYYIGQNELDNSSPLIYLSRYNKETTKCASDFDCHGNFEYCENSQCNCKLHFQHINGSKDCYHCPDEGHKCTDCCSSLRLRCNGEICVRCISEEGFDLCDSKSVIFITASQIALLAALVMGVAALATLLYRICTRPQLFARYNDNARRENGLRRLQRISRGSLSSIQIRVLARLCDRPPKYENHTNYMNRIQEPQQNESISGAELQINNNQPPPSYDGRSSTTNEFPPSYMETMGTSNSENNTEIVDISVINESDNENNSNIGYGRANTTNSPYSTSSENIHKTIHI